MTLLDLPPPYDQHALPPGACAFTHARALAPQAGAGTLVWSADATRLDCAIVLEPEQTLSTARGVLFAGLTAAADALAVDCPPEKPLAFAWPDSLLFDGGLVGGARLAWPADCPEDYIPAWLVLHLALRIHETETPGRPLPAALADDGFEEFAPEAFIEAYSRHLMVALDEWANRGPAAVFARWKQRWNNQGTADPAQLPTAQATPTWLTTDGAIAEAEAHP